MPRFGEPLDLPPEEKAAALTEIFRLTGWVPKQGQPEELQEFMGDVFAHLAQDPTVDLTDPDVLAAIEVGVSNELSRFDS